MNRIKALLLALLLSVNVLLPLTQTRQQTRRKMKLLYQVGRLIINLFQNIVVSLLQK